MTGLGTLRILEATQDGHHDPVLPGIVERDVRGHATAENEDTPFQPQSPYAAAKVYAYYVVKNYCGAYGLFVCNGIFFNHESPQRGETFVTREITRAATRIKLGLQENCIWGTSMRSATGDSRVTMLKRCGLCSSTISLTIT